MNKQLPLLSACLLVLISTATAASAQAPTGCAERDFKCQLDARMKALQDDPKNPENYYNLGNLWQRMGAHKEAVEAFSMYVSIPGVKPELLADGYNNRGISQRRLNRPDLAHADYTKATELHPRTPRRLPGPRCHIPDAKEKRACRSQRKKSHQAHRHNETRRRDLDRTEKNNLATPDSAFRIYPRAFPIQWMTARLLSFVQVRNLGSRQVRMFKGR